jgi:anti-sigma-K factor RskA
VTADLHTLTGAYVLDAIPGNELRAFEFHLNGCEPCAREVRELRAAAARLGLAAATAPPPRLKSRVLHQIHQVRQGGRTPAGRPRRLTRVFAAAAAVLLVIATALGVALARYQNVEDGQPVSALPGILRAEDARIVRATGPGGSGGHVMLVVSRGQDRLLLVTDGMRPPPPGHAYQIWTITPAYRSAGLLTGRDTTVEVPGIRDADRLAITVEPVGGSARPTGRTVASAPLT